MTKRGAILLTASAVFIMVVGLVLWIKHGEFWKIDGCLDSGGAWNYATKECEH